MKKLNATVISVHASDGEGLSKDEQQSIIVELDGVVGDRHRSFSREDVGRRQAAQRHRAP